MRLVVGAAIVRHGQVLAARRTEPADLARGWELAGGKVEPDEDPAAACAREIHEELDCVVEVGAPLGGDVDLREGWVLRVFRARLVAGEPAPLEHDALRWLGPEDLDDVAWLPAELPFVDALREELLDGEPLTGGGTGGAVRIGATVRRPTGSWTPTVHGLLDHLAGAGLAGVPRVLGTDARGREVLTYLPGRTLLVDVEEPAEEALAGAAAWLRTFHDAVATYVPPDGAAWRHGGGRPGAGQVVCHHDPGAYNWAVVGPRFAGMFDWDMAGPGDPVEDLAFLAWTGVPLHRPRPPAEVARRVRLLLEAYGSPLGVADLLDAAARRMSTAADRIEAGQRRGDTGMLALGELRGEPARTRERVADFRARLPAVLAAG